MLAESALALLLTASQPAATTAPDIFAPAPQMRQIDAAHASLYPPAPTLPADSLPGNHIQRTMRLLAESTAAHRNKVFILFYGQSITQQPWWRLVADDLRRRFPDADLRIENRAIGGFPSNLLIKSADYDLYPADPDLVIFQDYGGEPDLETIIERLRSRTKAEVAIQTEHVTETSTNQWTRHHNDVWLPKIAERYRCGLIPVRTVWQQALDAQHLAPSQLLLDTPHLNERGMFLMAGIVQQYLVVNPQLSADTQLVSRLPIPGTASGTATIAFDGNTVRAEASRAATRPLHFLIDGKPPSAFGLLQMTRPNGSVEGDWPWERGTILRVGHDRPWLPENWTAIIDALPSPAVARFHVTGTVTGEDGGGETDRVFRSRSGRVLVDPADWWNKNAQGGTTLHSGSTVQWSIYQQSADTWQPAKPGEELVVAQGLPNGHHVLQVEGDTGAIEDLIIEKPQFHERHAAKMWQEAMLAFVALLAACTAFWGLKRRQGPSLAAGKPMVDRGRA